jgi:hypothetical protein
MTPVVESRERPLGRTPDDIDQVYGAVPLVADKVAEYGMPIVDGATLVVIIEGAVCGPATIKAPTVPEPLPTA